MPDDVYTHGHAPAVLRSHTARTVANSAGYLVASLEPGKSLLDVGCGPGTITADFADRLAPGTVIGVDRSDEVLTVARAGAGDRSNLEYRVGDVYDLDFADGTFDIVHAHQVLQHLSDPVHALREMRRVCRPGGIVAARDADYGAFFWAPASPGIEAWRAAYCEVARRNGAEPDAGRWLKTWADAAGFDAVSVTFSNWTWDDRDTRTWWADLWADRITGTDLGDQMASYGVADRDGQEKMAAAFRAWAEVPAAVFVVPCGELLAIA